jgi:Secretion system C-terminal sorting domain
MKKTNLIIAFILLITITTNVIGQVANPTVQIIGLGTTNPTNSAEVPVGATLDLLITVGNTGTASITANRVRPRISVPTIVEILPDAQQTLPAGWSIVSSTTQAINICNGTDIIPVNGNRSIIIKVKGVSSGSAGSSVQLFFGGTGSCTATGPAQNSNVNDDAGSLTLTVVPALLPLTLTDFSATLKDCQPQLHWTTESEINTDRFEIERSNMSATDWKSIGNVAASGYSPTKINYSFTDKDLNASSEKVSYRLKMIDKDGSLKYSKILPVLVNCKTATILVYPNPVQDGKLYVSVTGTNGYVEATLLSASGQVILKNKINNGTNYLNVLNIAGGIYLLNVKDANGFDKNIKVSIRQ